MGPHKTHYVCFIPENQKRGRESRSIFILYVIRQGADGCVSRNNCIEAKYVIFGLRPKSNKWSII